MYQSFTFTVEESTILDYDLQGDIEELSFERCHTEHPSTSDDIQDERPSIETDILQIYPSLHPGTCRANVVLVHGPPQGMGLQEFVWAWAESKQRSAR